MNDGKLHGLEFDGSEIMSPRGLHHEVSVRSAAILLTLFAAVWVGLVGLMLVALTGFITDPVAQQEQASTALLASLFLVAAVFAGYRIRPARWALVTLAIAWLLAVIAVPQITGRDQFGRLAVDGALRLLLDGGLLAIVGPGLLAACMAALLLELENRSTRNLHSG